MTWQTFSDIVYTRRNAIRFVVLLIMVLVSAFTLFLFFLNGFSNPLMEVISVPLTCYIIWFAFDWDDISRRALRRYWRYHFRFTDDDFKTIRAFAEKHRMVHDIDVASGGWSMHGRGKWINYLDLEKLDDYMLVKLSFTESE